MTEANSRKIREVFYKAWVTRASDESQFAPNWDNSDLMVEILKKRNEFAKLMDCEDYASYIMQKRMCKSSQEANRFLSDIGEKAKSVGVSQWKELEKFALNYQDNKDNKFKLEPYDTLFYSEKMKKQQYGVADSILRPYFPVDKVINGLFDVMQKVFSIKLELIDKDRAKALGLDIIENAFYHPDVKVLKITRADKNNAYIILDLFARQKKRGGAWMHDMSSRMKLLDNKYIEPIATVTCNFQSKLPGNRCSVLLHDDVVTLFHEMGHALQHVLTKVDYLSISGIAHVPWDAVEVCSQFLENYCWDANIIKSLSSHIETNQPLPNDLINKLLEARKFNGALGVLRQVQFGIFDLSLHMKNKNKISISEITNNLHQARAKYSVYEFKSYDRFQHAFSHIFAGGYAAGYYSYLWAEMISCHLFNKVKKIGSHAVRESFYEKGGAIDPSDLFFLCCGEKENISYLLENYGI